MRKAIVVKGHVTGPTTVELHEQVAATGSEIEVLVPLPDDRQAAPSEAVVFYLRRQSADTQTKDLLDQRIDAERKASGTR